MGGFIHCCIEESFGIPSPTFGEFKMHAWLAWLFKSEFNAWELSLGFLCVKSEFMALCVFLGILHYCQVYVECY